MPAIRNNILMVLADKTAERPAATARARRSWPSEVTRETSRAAGLRGRGRRRGRDAADDETPSKKKRKKKRRAGAAGRRPCTSRTSSSSDAARSRA
ncbi:MAG: hypothetical protein MZW92_18585 [Comamonadaceae bacterium]|nr:hypothetical protein [Comamonadaceae bacterium]